MQATPKGPMGWRCRQHLLLGPPGSLVTDPQLSRLLGATSLLASTIRLANTARTFTMC